MNIQGLVPQAVQSKIPFVISLIGSPDVFRLRKKPINSLSYVRSSVHLFRSYSLDRSIFFSNFLHEVVSPYDLDDHQKFFRSKKFLTPKMAIFECFWPISSKRRYKFS